MLWFNVLEAKEDRLSTPLISPTVASLKNPESCSTGLILAPTSRHLVAGGNSIRIALLVAELYFIV
jgi:hypothetical protein